MKRLAALLCPLAFLTVSAAPMLADTFVNFSFTGNDSVSGVPGTPFSGSGVFDAVATKTPGRLLITSVTGTTDGLKISELIGKNGFFGNDNFLFTSGSTYALDNAGVSYRLSNGVDVGVFLGEPNQYQEELFGFPGQLVSESQTANVTFGSTSVTPEPSSFVLLGTGALGLFGAARRRFAV